jgi:hypothetical protein
VDLPTGAALLKGPEVAVMRFADDVVVVAGVVNMVAFLGEVVLPVGVEVAAGFEGA